MINILKIFLIFNTYFFSLLYKFYISYMFLLYNFIIINSTKITVNFNSLQENIYNIIDILIIFIFNILCVIIHYFIVIYKFNLYFFKDFYILNYFFFLSINRIIELKLILKYSNLNVYLYCIYFIYNFWIFYKLEFYLLYINRLDKIIRFLKINLKVLKLNNNNNNNIKKIFYFFKIKKLKIFDSLNIIEKLKSVNYNRLRMRLSYLKSKIWYDLQYFEDMIIIKKKNLKFFFFYYIDKLNFFILKKKGYKINYKLFLCIKKFCSILIFIKDLFKNFLIIKFNVKIKL